MPKKHKNYPLIKPASTAHPSLLLSSSTNRHNHDGHSPSPESAAPERSVNQLIQHLRRTQVSNPSSHGETSPISSPSPALRRTVHPSLRNLLELPETPPPRPRRNARVIPNGHRIRRTPGPPPPLSWTERGSPVQTHREGITIDSEQLLYRLSHLPGVEFPLQNSLQNTLLKSMAQRWRWHLEYDGEFLAELPSLMKMLLLSYIAMYSHGVSLRGLMRGLYPLFQTQSRDESDVQQTEPEVVRLDLSCALGRWISLKQLCQDLFIKSRRPSETSRIPVPSQSKAEDASVPTSWEDDSDSDPASSSSFSPAPVVLPDMPAPRPRFENLQFLSLGHPDPFSASWPTLLTLLPRILTLTHLSLAHWPMPTLTPNSMNARIRHPTQRSLSFAYSGTDGYAAFEGNWAEASTVLRKLSRATYCLQWLNLEGCGDWFGALSWDGVGPDGAIYHSPGPEWNGSWRNIEWLGLGPGWLPRDSGVLESWSPSSSIGGRVAAPLAVSIHAPPAHDITHTNNNNNNSGIALPNAEASLSSRSDIISWDVEAERIKYRRAKEVEAYENIIRKAKAVETHVHNVRKSHGGKWIQISFGGEELEEKLLREQTTLKIAREVNQDS